MVFGRWTALKEAGRRHRGVLWLCRCSCGTEKIVGGLSLRNGASKSCGCLGREVWRESAARMRAKKGDDGHTKTPEFRSWRNMLDRCENPKSKSYHNYGGRGITVCADWHQFKAFIRDMGSRPIGTTLERINNDGNYEPSNCKWATAMQQRRNSRQNRFLTFNGRSQCVVDWAKTMGVPRTLLQNRLHKGWSVEEALSTPRLKP